MWKIGCLIPNINLQLFAIFSWTSWNEPKACVELHLGLCNPDI